MTDQPYFVDYIAIFLIIKNILGDKNINFITENLNQLCRNRGVYRLTDWRVTTGVIL